MGQKLTLEQQIARKEAQLNKLKSQQREKERKKETRRLIYHGRLLEKFMTTGVISQSQYESALDEMLVRNYDREFFGLPLYTEEPKRQRAVQKKSSSSGAAGKKVVKKNVATSHSGTSTGKKKLNEHEVSEAEFLT